MLPIIMVMTGGWLKYCFTNHVLPTLHSHVVYLVVLNYSLVVFYPFFTSTWHDDPTIHQQVAGVIIRWPRLLRTTTAGLGIASKR